MYSNDPFLFYCWLVFPKQWFVSFVGDITLTLGSYLRKTDRCRTLQHTLEPNYTCIWADLYHERSPMYRKSCPLAIQTAIVNYGGRGNFYTRASKLIMNNKLPERHLKPGFHMCLRHAWDMSQTVLASFNSIVSGTCLRHLRHIWKPALTKTYL